MSLAQGIDISLYEEDATKEEEDNPAHDIIIRQVESLDAKPSTLNPQPSTLNPET
jgi:hypothetical protein